MPPLKLRAGFVVEVRMDLDPFPALGADSLRRLSPASCASELVEKLRMENENAVLVVPAEKIAADGAASLFVSLERDEFHALVGGGDFIRRSGRARMSEGIVVVFRQVFEDVLLRGMVVADGEGHDLFKIEMSPLR